MEKKTSSDASKTPNTEREESNTSSLPLSLQPGWQICCDFRVNSAEKSISILWWSGRNQGTLPPQLLISGCLIWVVGKWWFKLHQSLNRQQSINMPSKQILTRLDTERSLTLEWVTGNLNSDAWLMQWKCEAHGESGSYFDVVLTSVYKSTSYQVWQKYESK